MFKFFRGNGGGSLLLKRRYYNFSLFEVNNSVFLRGAHVCECGFGGGGKGLKL